MKYDTWLDNCNETDSSGVSYCYRCWQPDCDKRDTPREGISWMGSRNDPKKKAVKR